MIHLNMFFILSYYMNESKETSFSAEINSLTTKRGKFQSDERGVYLFTITKQYFSIRFYLFEVEIFNL